MSTRYENYNAGDDSYTYFLGNERGLQTFTPSVAHKITSVKLLLARVGSPGIETVSIRATSGGLPTGNDLCSGTINCAAISESPTSAWYEITLGAGANLAANTKYAIIWTPAAGDNSSNRVHLRADSSSPAYAGGAYVYAGNIDNWAEYTSWDFMFEEWGEAIVAAGRSFGFIIG
jgi:hypothetical protein